MKKCNMLEIRTHLVNNIAIGEVLSDEIVLDAGGGIVDMAVSWSYQGVSKLIIYQKNISPDFFDLKTRLAGEILQKFTLYNVSLAIIGDFSVYNSRSLRDFIYESNKAGKIIFSGSLEQALSALSK